MLLEWIKEVRNIVILILIIIAATATASALYNWYKPPEIVTKTEYVKVPEIKTVTKIQKVNVPGPKEIVTVEKEVVIEKLKLPEWIKENSDLQVIATAAVPPYKGTTNTVAVIDTKSGKSEIVLKQEPLPLFALINEKEIGIRGGYVVEDSKIKTEASVYGKWDFVRVGNAYLGVYAEGNTNGNAKAMLSIGYRF